MTKIPVYFVPGLAASSSIFENIKLPDDQFEMILLDWQLPMANESLQQYCKRWTRQITHQNPVLIGVSFGGVVVQEMSKLIAVRKVIIISSAKCNSEFPLRMRLAKYGGLYKLIPTSLLTRVKPLDSLPIGSTKIKKRLKLYERYIGVRDQQYLDWAIKALIFWDRCEPDPNIIHIHGDADEIFPAKYVKNYISVPGGTHIMILNKSRWLNKHLPKIILAHPDEIKNKTFK
ncbi:MAG: alpha/beta hydrolase [Flavobacterium sp.]|nr:alpha/beta hydrolase [Flavobacterium sp.]